MRKQRYLMAFHYTLRTIILLGISGYIVYLVETNTLQLYIGWRIMPLVKWSAVLIYPLAVIQAVIAYRHFKGDMKACDCCTPPPSKSWWRNGLVYSLLMLPLLLGFLLPSTVLGGSFANTKGITLNSVFANRNNPIAKTESDLTVSDDSIDHLLPPSDPTPEQLDQMFYTEDQFETDLAELGKRLYVLPVIKVKPEIYMEVLSSIVVFIDHFVGKEIEISGFAYREPDMTDNQLVIGRIAVQCCTADAAPYGVLTEFDEAPEFPDDTWLSVRGTIGYTEYKGNKILKIDVTESSIMKAPDNPYIYPNFSFLDENVE
ncbi:putative repeat protein (TIGR03943 family) [Fontibacillus solani]|uniref:Putative repeat protein (TIGR03943 family) n=1 Tax=Fontibacillus solani TaxID=1572857 RepID=A0A7W3XT14_9BACL|nr:TIGR03943 family protein [Fontibacillus solani]MBA9087138.1 putative repeat protein (TIGR03943 family) [Fontibacillus solani]